MAARNGSGFWKKVKWIFLRAVMVVVLVLFGLEFVNLQQREAKPVEGGGRAAQRAPFVTLENLPEYTGRSFVVLYGNKPQFSEEFKAKENPYYSFTPLDALGRCGPAYGKLGPEFLPTKPRGPIGMIKPSGWQFSKYDEIDKKYLYNRCHLLAFQLYIRQTRKHVFYRVTPVFYGRELVARGVTMEALSADDGGRALHFHVFVYNVQPGIVINYADGANHRQ